MKFILKNFKTRLRLLLVMQKLRLRNVFCFKSAVGTTPTIISLTSHGKRIQHVWYTLESLAAGQIRPQRIMVWLDLSMKENLLPRQLERLRRRGVEFRFVKDIGPHQKYFYAIDEALSDGLTLTTVDDDCLYSTWWLQDLFNAHCLTPDIIVCYRARKFSFRTDGLPDDYINWPYVAGVFPRKDVFFTGVSGVMYPANFLSHLKGFGTQFLDCCPRADDIWLNYVAAKTDTLARQVFPVSWGFTTLPDTQDIALWSQNAAGRNDAQILETYDAETLTKIGYFAICVGGLESGHASTAPDVVV